MTNAVFLDRDGVINHLVFNPDLGLIDSPLNPNEFKLMPGAAEAIKKFNRLGLKVIVVSNQPGIAKGKMSEELFDADTPENEKFTCGERCPCGCGILLFTPSRGFTG